MKDEYDNNEFKSIYDNNNTLVLADVPGAGKTTSCKNYDKECLIITPFNKLSLENIKDGLKSITFNSWSILSNQN